MLNEESLKTMSDEDLNDTYKEAKREWRRAWCRACVAMGLHPDDAPATVCFSPHNPYHDRVNDAGGTAQQIGREINRRIAEGGDVEPFG